MPNTHAIILAGGLGTRLPVSARTIPKSLVEVHGKPILQHQLERLYAAGMRDIRLALGFRADQIISFLKSSDYPCEYVVETEPLKNGGAARLASEGLSEPFIILNGDILADFDYQEIVYAHEAGTALMVAAWRGDARDYGLLRLRKRNVVELLGKPAALEPGFVHVGCTIVCPEHLAAQPGGIFSLEWDVLAPLAKRGGVRAYIHRGFAEDVGTEERLERVRRLPLITF